MDTFGTSMKVHVVAEGGGEIEGYAHFFLGCFSTVD